jgi:hypothetical protein
VDAALGRGLDGPRPQAERQPPRQVQRYDVHLQTGASLRWAQWVLGEAGERSIFKVRSGLYWPQPQDDSCCDRSSAIVSTSEAGASL